MLQPNPPGRPTDLNEKLIDHITSFLKDNHSQRQVARMACVPQSKISEWLSKGEDHLKNDTDSIYAQFTIKYRQAEGKAIHSLLEEMRNLGNYQALSWLLEKCHYEDYGNEAPLVKEFKEAFLALKEMKGDNHGSQKGKQDAAETEEA